MHHNRDRFKLILSMGIFGTIGIFRHFIPCSSAFIAFARGLIGAVFIAVIMLLRKKRPNLSAVRAKLLPLILSGACIGVNWVLLFEAYRYTSVSVATACYYMAPIFSLLGAAVLFRERLTVRKIFCIIIAFVGTVLVSGAVETGISGLKGCLLGLSAAFFYACVILLNRSMPQIDALERTAMQLAAAAMVAGLYTAATGEFSLSLDLSAAVLLLIVGVVHTGFAYALYFSGVSLLPTQTVAILSYIDPVLSILLSAAILREPLTLSITVGIVLVLGSTAVSELFPEKKA